MLGRTNTNLYSGVSLYGNLTDYVVKSGESITAGDSVEFYDDLKIAEVYSDTQYESPRWVYKLSDGSFFIAHHGRFAVVGENQDGSIVLLKAWQRISDSSMPNDNYLYDIIQIDDDEFFVYYIQSSVSNYVTTVKFVHVFLSIDVNNGYASTMTTAVTTDIVTYSSYRYNDTQYIVPCYESKSFDIGSGVFETLFAIRDYGRTTSSGSYVNSYYAYKTNLTFAKNGSTWSVVFNNTTLLASVTGRTSTTDDFNCIKTSTGIFGRISNRLFFTTFGANPNVNSIVNGMSFETPMCVIGNYFYSIQANLSPATISVKRYVCNDIQNLDFTLVDTIILDNKSINTSRVGGTIISETNNYIWYYFYGVKYHYVVEISKLDYSVKLIVNQFFEDNHTFGYYIWSYDGYYSSGSGDIQLFHRDVFVKMFTDGESVTSLDEEVFVKKASNLNFIKGIAADNGVGGDTIGVWLPQISS